MGHKPGAKRLDGGFGRLDAPNQLGLPGSSPIQQIVVPAEDTRRWFRSIREAMTNAVRIGQIEDGEVCIVRRDLDEVSPALRRESGNGVELTLEFGQRFAFEAR